MIPPGSYFEGIENIFYQKDKKWARKSLPGLLFENLKKKLDISKIILNLYLLFLKVP